MESLRTLSLPRGGKTFITSGRSSPSTSRETAAYPRSLHPSPRASLEQLLDTCEHLQSDLHCQRRALPPGRSRSSTRLLESGHSKGRWRDTEHYIATRAAILRAIDRQKFANDEQGIAVVKQFVSSQRRGSIVRLHAPQLRVTCADLQNQRVRTLLSLNKRDFGRPFDLSKVHLIEEKKAIKPVIRVAEEEDGVMLKREIAKLQQETMYKSEPKRAPVEPVKSTSPAQEVAVDMEQLGPLSRFILKEGGKYNSAWLSETRRYRQKTLQEAYLRGWEKNSGTANRVTERKHTRV